MVCWLRPGRSVRGTKLVMAMAGTDLDPEQQKDLKEVPALDVGLVSCVDMVGKRNQG